jgi:hypothetical protein
VEDLRRVPEVDRHGPRRSTRGAIEAAAGCLDEEVEQHRSLAGRYNQQVAARAEPVSSGSATKEVSDEALIPFGGVGESGTGSRHGGTQANLDAFTEVQWVTVRGDLPQYPF